MSSIDFIDEVGREWAHASRYRVLEEENAALRKRVAELEAQIECDQRDPEHANCRNVEAQLERQLELERARAERAEQRVAELETRAQHALGCREKGPRGEGIGHSGTYESVCTSCTERYRRAERQVSDLEAMQDEILQHEEIEEPVNDGSENLASVVHNALDALQARAEKAERERDDYRAQAVERKLRLEESAHACDRLQADLDAALALLSLPVRLWHTHAPEELKRYDALLEKRRERG